MEIKTDTKELSIFHKKGKIFWSSNVLTNVMYFFEPEYCVKGPFKQVNKNLKKAAETVINVWRYQGTQLIEKSLDRIEKNKKDFMTSGRREAYREAAANLKTIRHEALKKSNAIPLPVQGADRNNLVTVAYLSACVMSNGYRGLKGDDNLAGLESKQKDKITSYLFPNKTVQQTAVAKLGEQLLRDPGKRFEAMQIMIQDQELVDLMVQNPFDLFSEDELETLNWCLNQTEQCLSSRCDDRCHLMYLALKNFLKLMIEIESDKVLRDRRWDHYAKVE